MEPPSRDEVRKSLGMVGWPLPLEVHVAKGGVVKGSSGKYALFSFKVRYRHDHFITSSEEAEPLFSAVPPDHDESAVSPSVLPRGRSVSTTATSPPPREVVRTLERPPLLPLASSMRSPTVLTTRGGIAPRISSVPEEEDSDSESENRELVQSSHRFRFSSSSRKRPVDQKGRDTSRLEFLEETPSAGLEGSDDRDTQTESLKATRSASLPSPAARDRSGSDTTPTTVGDVDSPRAVNPADQSSATPQRRAIRDLCELWSSIDQELVTWTISKRFSDCLALHEALKARFQRIPPFPRKTIFRILDPAHMESRRRRLNFYFSELVKRREIMCAPEIREFFRVPPHVEALDKRFRMTFVNRLENDPVEALEVRDEEYGCVYACIDEKTRLLTVVTNDRSSISSPDTLASNEFKLPWEPQVNLYPASRIAFWELTEAPQLLSPELDSENLLGRGARDTNADYGNLALSPKQSFLVCSKLLTTPIRASCHGVYGECFYLFLALSDNRLTYLRAWEHSTEIDEVRPPPRDDIHPRGAPVSYLRPPGAPTIGRALGSQPLRPPPPTAAVQGGIGGVCSHWLAGAKTLFGSLTVDLLAGTQYGAEGPENGHRGTCRCDGLLGLCSDIDLGGDFRTGCAVLAARLDDVSTMAFSTELAELFIGCSTGHILALGLEDKRSRRITSLACGVTSLTVTEGCDMQVLHAAGTDGNVLLIDAARREILAVMNTTRRQVISGTMVPFGCPVGALASATISVFEPSGNEKEGRVTERMLVAAGNAERSLAVWLIRGRAGSLRSTEISNILATRHMVTSMDISPDGGFLLCGEASGNISIFKVTGAGTVPLFTWTGHSMAVTRTRWLDSGNALLTASKDGVVKLWAF